MRDILFRAKRLDNGEWVEGNLFIPDLPNSEFQICIGTHIIRISYAIDPKTIGQFTGMLDKNGKKIFEGDIVRCYVERCVGCYPYSEKVTLPVTYQAGVFAPLFACDHKSIEIVGNIHDTLVMEE